jgi:hypothetical protein
MGFCLKGDRRVGEISDKRSLANVAVASSISAGLLDKVRSNNILN